MKTFRIYVRDNALQAFDVEALTKEGALAILENAITAGTIDDESESHCEFINMGISEWETDAGIESVEELKEPA